MHFKKSGTHRRIRFVDLLEFKKQADDASEKAMDELVKLGQELDMGY